MSAKIRSDGSGSPSGEGSIATDGGDHSGSAEGAQTAPLAPSAPPLAGAGSSPGGGSGATPPERLVRHAGIIASATMVSRVAGFVRDAAVLAVFGASGADPFVLAFVLPNVLRRLLAEGSLTIAFLPVFAARFQQDGKEAARAFADKAFTVASIGLALVVVVGVLAAEPIIDLLASEWREDGDKFELTVLLARWVFPYLWMVGLVALAMGVLNTVRRFFIPAASPVLLNLGIIFGVLVMRHWVDPPILGVAFGVLLGGAAQVLLNAYALSRSGFLPRPDFRFNDPDLRRLFVLMLPATFGASIHQINVLLSKAFAASVGDGAVSWLYSADRLIELPLGVFAVSMAVAALPSLSEHAAAGRTERYKETLSDGLRQVLFIMVPAAVGLIVVALPAIAVVFQRGEFDHSDARAAAMALSLFAVGLPAVACTRVVVQGFYALQDTRTPVLVGILSVAVFWTGARLLTGPLGHGGIALATSIAAYVNLLFCLALLRRKVGRLGLRRIAITLARIVPAAALMGGVAFGLVQLGDWELGAAGLDLPTLRNVAVFFTAVGAGATVFAVSSFLFGSAEARTLAAYLRRRLRRGKAG